MHRFRVGETVKIRAPYPLPVRPGSTSIIWENRLGRILSQQSPDWGRTKTYELQILEAPSAYFVYAYERELEPYNHNAEAIKVLGEEYFDG